MPIIRWVIAWVMPDLSKSPAKQSSDVRLLAVSGLASVLRQGESLSTVLPRLSSIVNPKDRALLQALVYGVLRWRWRIDALLKPFLKKPIKEKDLEVQLILMLGVFQIEWMRIPDYAVVDAAVKSATRIQRPWATGVINGVLRNYLRSREAADEAGTYASLSAEYSHPQWLIEKIRKDWPQHWQQILDENNHPPPMTLRIDTQQISMEDYLQQLAAAGIKAERLLEVPSALVLESALDVSLLPGFAEGQVSVQDAAAQLAAELLDLRPGNIVLDACAAPGGKTCHILQHTSPLQLDAVDISAERLVRVEENLKRMHLQANLITADISLSGDWCRAVHYDRILLDAPCSASGVIRRHPDIKSLRKPTDIAQLLQTQQQILDNVWTCLRPGGLMLYATCSVFKDENENQVKQFVKRTPDVMHIPLDLSVGIKREYGTQILPGNSQMDGFYYALLQKAT